MKKVIGIIARPDKTIDNNYAFIVNKNLITCLNNYNVIPLIITPPGKYNYHNLNYSNGPKITNKELSQMIFLINKCNGIILQGGDEFYDYDIKIIDYLYKKNISTLGICLGMQSISFYGNGTYYNINNNNHYKTKHYVKINKDSKLYLIINKEIILVNSRHKSAIKNTKFKINAISEEGIIEGIEDNNKKFFMAFQWHPEDLFDNNQKKIIESFIKSL